MTTKTKQHNKVHADLFDMATELHNQLVHLSQTIPPQVSLGDVLMKAAAVRDGLAGSIEAPAE